MTSADRQPPTGFFAPWRRARLWVTLLWTLTLGVGAAGWDWAERRLGESAAERTVVMAPERPLDEEARREAARRIAAEPGVSGARWRSPAELARQAAQRFPASQWGELFPSEEGWLPWMLEVRWRDPLGQSARVSDFVARQEGDGVWRMVLWDADAVGRLVRARQGLRALLGFWLTVVALAGALGLARLVWPAPGGAAEWGWGAVLGTAGPASVWAAVSLAGPWADGRSLAVAAGVGLLAAGVVGPVLRRRQRETFALTVKEEADERSSASPG